IDWHDLWVDDQWRQLGRSWLDRLCGFLQLRKLAFPLVQDAGSTFELAAPVFDLRCRELNLFDLCHGNFLSVIGRENRLCAWINLGESRATTAPSHCGPAYRPEETFHAGKRRYRP